TRQRAIRAHGKLARRAKRIRCHFKPASRAHQQCFTRQSIVCISVDYDAGHLADLLASAEAVVERNALSHTSRGESAPYRQSREERWKDGSGSIMSSRPSIVPVEGAHPVDTEGSFLARLGRKLLLGQLSKLQHGSIRIVEADAEHRFGKRTPECDLSVTV